MCPKLFCVKTSCFIPNSVNSKEFYAMLLFRNRRAALPVNQQKGMFGIYAIKENKTYKRHKTFVASLQLFAGFGTLDESCDVKTAGIF